MTEDRDEGPTPATDQVTPLDHVANFTIQVSEGYVKIEQTVGGQVYYTPTEAREIAEDILAATEEASVGGI